jgi:hypothetical protein
MWVIPISRKTSMASLRIGPRQMISGRMWEQSNCCTQARNVAEATVAVDQRMLR